VELSLRTILKFLEGIADFRFNLLQIFFQVFDVFHAQFNSLGELVDGRFGIVQPV
jgi:hypothetical protein